MMLMMKKSGNGGMLDKMLPMMLMGGFGGNGGGFGGMNPMMMLAMLGDEGGSGLGGLFGGSSGGGIPAQLIGQAAPPLRPSNTSAPQLYRTR